MTRELEGYLCEGGVWGSNTSTLPISQLAEASARPENFIGIHFFSPVDKMPLVEIIVGEQTSEETLARPSTLPARFARPPSWSTIPWAFSPPARSAPIWTRECAS